MPAGVGAAPVAEDDEHPRVRVELSQVAVPDAPDVPAHELGGVVAGAYREVARVARQVVDAVRHDHASGEGREVVVVGLGGGRAVHLPAALEVARRLLLLGVHADDGYPGPYAGLLRRAYLHELGVPVLRLAQRQALGERPPPEPRRLEHLPDDVVGHVVATPEHLAAYLPDPDVYPDDAPVLREPRHAAGDDVVEGRHPFGMLVGLLLRPAAGHALLAGGRRDVAEEFPDPLAHGVRGASEGLAHGPYRAAAGACRLACNKKPSFAFVKCAKVLLFRLANLYWRFFLHQRNLLETSYKDTKIPPVILCYNANNQ